MPMLDDYEKLIADGVVYVIAPEDEIIAVLVIWPVEDAMWIDNIKLVDLAIPTMILSSALLLKSVM